MFILTNSILTYTVAEIVLLQNLIVSPVCTSGIARLWYIYMYSVPRLLMAAKLAHIHVYDNLHRQASTLQIERFPYVNTTCTCTCTMYVDLHTMGARTN